jgi:hypothetical protein
MSYRSFMVGFAPIVHAMDNEMAIGGFYFLTVHVPKYPG